ncbi:MAG: hypothetical protein HIU84_14700 [Acidobacteria bacterium]|nr:hypothetical protein [Acidobacteriota bacterium]
MGDGLYDGSPRGRSGPTLADIPLTSSPSSITDARGTRASAATTVPGTRAQAPRGPVRNKEATTSSKKGTPPTAPDRSNAPVDAGAQGVTAVTLPPAPVTDTGHASKATPTASGTPSYERGPTSGAANVMNNAGSPRVAPSDTKVMPPAIAPSDQTAGATPVVTSPPVAPSHTEVASTSQGLLVAQTQGAHVASDTAKASEVSVGLSLPAAARSSKTVATNVVIPSSSGSEGSASKANAATGNVPAPSASASSTAREVVSFAQNPPVTPPVTGTAVATPTASSFPTVDITSLVPGPDSGPSTANSVMGSASNSQSVAPFREAVSSARGAAQSSSSRTSVSSLETLAGSVGAAVQVNTSATSVSTQPTMSLGASTIASSHGVAGALGETRLSTLDVGGLSSAISRPLSEGNGTYSVSLAMHPIELGHVQAVMTLSGGELQVSLTAHTEHGHAALTASMNDLKNELARGGVNVTIDLRNPQSQTPDEGRTRRATESTSRPTAPTTTFATAPTPARDTGQIHLML